MNPIGHLRTDSVRNGSVALEYLLALGMGVPLLVFWLALFEPGVGYTNAGRQFMQYFQRMLTGVSLPIP